MIRRGFDWWPIERVTDPKSGVVQVMRDYWWVTDGEGNILVWAQGEVAYPQCNPNRKIVERTMRALQPVPKYTLIQLPRAFFPRSVE